MSSSLVKRIEKFVKDNGEITVPIVQRKFFVEYDQARSAIKSLEDSGVVEYESGLAFKFVRQSTVQKKQEKNEEAIDDEEDREDIIARRRRELLERLRKMSDDD